MVQLLWAVPGVDYCDCGTSPTPALDAAQNAEVVVMVMGGNKNIRKETFTMGEKFCHPFVFNLKDMRLQIHVIPRNPRV